MLELFWTFFKIGLFTFGGGYAMIAQVKETIVEKKQWMTEDELVQMLAIAESTPGPIAINMATYVGYKRKGVLGSALATCGVVLPSLVIIYVISLFLDAFMRFQPVAWAFTGIKCAVAFLILRAGYGLFKKLPRKVLPMSMFVVVMGIMLALELFSVSFSSVFLILAGGLIGIVVYGIMGAKKGAVK
ncbi:MAG: chromate transporter [Clostridia bacterium]|nr:chromate transporter [Clostridia bacterium]